MNNQSNVSIVSNRPCIAQNIDVVSYDPSRKLKSVFFLNNLTKIQRQMVSQKNCSVAIVL